MAPCITRPGAVQSLAYASQSVQALGSTLGAHGDYPIKLSGGLFIPRFRIEYQHDFANRPKGTPSGSPLRELSVGLTYALIGEP